MVNVATLLFGQFNFIIVSEHVFIPEINPHCILSQIYALFIELYYALFFFLLFVFCISWNFARDISTVFEEIKHLRSRAPEKYFARLLK